MTKSALGHQRAFSMRLTPPLQNELGQRVHELLGFTESDRVVFYIKQI